MYEYFLHIIGGKIFHTNYILGAGCNVMQCATFEMTLYYLSPFVAEYPACTSQSRAPTNLSRIENTVNILYHHFILTREEEEEEEEI